jgi:hypothetical protein
MAFFGFFERLSILAAICFNAVLELQLFLGRLGEP